MTNGVEELQLADVMEDEADRKVRHEVRVVPEAIDRDTDGRAKPFLAGSRRSVGVRTGQLERSVAAAPTGRKRPQGGAQAVPRDPKGPLLACLFGSKPIFDFRPNFTES